jgi:hypothetical protein
MADSDRYVYFCPLELLIDAHALTRSRPLRVFDLKVSLQKLTRVPPERQKILGLVKGKLPPDQARMYVLCQVSIGGVHRTLVWIVQTLAWQLESNSH